MIKDQIKEINKEIEVTQSKLESLFKQLEELIEKEKETDDRYIKCICINCDGIGYVPEKDKHVVCPLCRGRQYMWVKKYV